MAFSSKKRSQKPLKQGRFLLFLSSDSIAIVLFLLKECLDPLSELDSLERSAHVLDTELKPLVLALYVLLVVVNNNVGNKVTDLGRFKILRLCLGPGELLCILIVQKIPELALCIAPKKIVYLVATAGR